MNRLSGISFGGPGKMAAIVMVAGLWLNVPPAKAFLPVFSDVGSSTLYMTVPGERLDALVGAPVAELRLFAAPEGKVEIIPFQVDSRPDGKQYAWDSDPTRISDRIGRADELLFMIRDCGPRLAPERWPTGTQDVLELLVAHPDGRLGYVYAARFGNPPPLSARTYVTYDAARDHVSSSAWIIRYRKDNPLVFDDVIYRDLTGRTDETIADGMRIRVKARTLGTMLTLTRNEDEFRSKLLGYRAGPIRVIRYVELYFDLGPIPLTTMYARFDISARMFEAQVSFQLSVAVNALLDDLSAIVGVDYLDLKGVTFSTAAEPAGRPITGNSAPEGVFIPYGKEEWFTLSGRGLYQFNFLDFEPGLKLENNAFLRDGPDPNPPERFRGQFPLSGYSISRWTGVGTRRHSFRIVITNLEGVPSGGGSAMYRLYRNLPTSAVVRPGPTKVVVAAAGADAERLRSLVVAGGYEISVRGKDALPIEPRSDLYVLGGHPATSPLRNLLQLSRIPVIDWNPAGKVTDPGEARRGLRLVVGGLPEPAVLGRVLLASKPGAPVVMLGQFDSGWAGELERSLGAVKTERVPRGQLPDGTRETVVLLAPDLAPDVVGKLSDQAVQQGLLLFALSREAVDAGAALGYVSPLDGPQQVVPSVIQAWIRGTATAELRDTRELVVNRTVVRAQRTQLPAGILQLAKPVN